MYLYIYVQIQVYTYYVCKNAFCITRALWMNLWLIFTGLEYS